MPDAPTLHQWNVRTTDIRLGPRHPLPAIRPTRGLAFWSTFCDILERDGIQLVSGQRLVDLVASRWPDETGSVGTPIELRPVAETDLDQLLRFFTDDGLAGEFQWFGHRLQHAIDIRRRWQQ